MQQNETIVLGGGCFWCTEAVFKMLKGVTSVMPGYAGSTSSLQAGSDIGHIPTYEEVCGGETGFVEAVKIEYDPTEVNYTDLLTVFFGSHDPTTVNRQGADVGTQYRSVIFFTTDDQKKQTEDFIAQLNASNEKGAPIVTEVEALDKFYDAESYHKDFYARNQGNSYCEIVINPKLQKVQEKYAVLLKKQDNTL